MSQEVMNELVNMSQEIIKLKDDKRELLFVLKYALPFIAENAITAEAYENGGRKVADVIRAAIAKAEDGAA
jgi:hypothetical protein